MSVSFYWSVYIVLCVIVKFCEDEWISVLEMVSFSLTGTMNSPVFKKSYVIAVDCKLATTGLM